MKGLIFILLFALPASAQVTYNYVGAPLAVTVTGTVGLQPIPTNVTGSVTLATALNPNQANQVVVPQIFAFNVTINAGEEPFQAPNVFVFSTSNGVITDWYIALDLLEGVILTSSGGGDFYQGSTYTGTCSHFQNCQTVVGTNVAAGTWGLQGDAPPPSLQAQLTAAQAQIASLQKATDPRDE